MFFHRLGFARVRRRQAPCCCCSYATDAGERNEEIRSKRAKKQRLEPVRGTDDVWEEEFRRQNRIETAAREAASLFGFAEVRPPLLERASLFLRHGSDGPSDSALAQKQLFEVRPLTRSRPAQFDSDDADADAV